MFPAETKFLVVDDFSSMRRIVKNCLNQIGYKNLEEADDGTTAWAKLQKIPVGFIVCDWNMPQMTGLELLEKVRSDPKLKALPFLMVTAEAEKEKVFAAVKAGVSNYVVKPFTADTLQEKIQAIYARISKTQG